MDKAERKMVLMFNYNAPCIINMIFVVFSPLFCLLFSTLNIVTYMPFSEEATPESIVERSLLRQCIENALAAELSPHERDIVRLRHGLDTNGVSRTVKEVMESCGGMLSQADIRAAESRAYRKLRIPHSIHNARLREFAAEAAMMSKEC